MRNGEQVELCRTCWDEKEAFVEQKKRQGSLTEEERKSGIDFAISEVRVESESDDEGPLGACHGKRKRGE